MKKNLLVLLLIAFILPSVALASWWNPFSWFKKIPNDNVGVVLPKEDQSKNDVEVVVPKEIKEVSLDVELIRKNVFLCNLEIKSEIDKFNKEYKGGGNSGIAVPVGIFYNCLSKKMEVTDNVRVYIENNSESATPPFLTNIITAIGNYTCLETNPRNVYVTLECAVGIKGEDGLDYGVNYPSKGWPSMGKGKPRIKVVGKFDQNSDDYKMSKYNIVGIISATSMEELPPINFIFKYGVGAENILNTFDKTFTKDMIMEKDVTIKFELSASDLQNISKKIKELNLLNIKPNPVSNTKVTMIRTPCSSYSLKTDIDSVQKEISWNDCNAEIKDEYKKFTDYVIKIIESKDEYKKLPKVKGVYQ